MNTWVFPASMLALAMSPTLLAFAKFPRRMVLAYTAALAACGVGLVVSSMYGWRFVENRTSSLPGHVYSYRMGSPVERGDLVAFIWNGAGQYPAGSVFLKRVYGVEGDLVRVVGRDVYVGSTHIGAAKERTKSGMDLAVTHSGPVPIGQVFVATPNPDSFDSRYEIVGTIPAERILGKAYELF